MRIWQNRMFRRCLARRHYLRNTHKNQLSPSCPDCSHSSHVLTLQLALSFHTLFLSQSLQIKTHMKYKVHKIKHNYNQIWHEIKANKNIVINYNFTISHFSYSVTKPLKQTLDLKVSLGIVAKLTHT